MTNALFRSCRYPVLAAAMTAGLLLSGCAPAAPDIAPFNRIQVKTVQLSHMVHFAPSSATLSQAETANLQAFLGADRRDGVGGITIVGGDSAIADARRASVSQALDNLGLAHHVAPADPNFTADAVVVTANREAALPPVCPPWAAIGSFNPSNGAINTLGCATAADLYLMVADPRDLVSGHAEGSTDAAPSMRAVEAYRTGDQKANPQAESFGSGSTSSGSGGATSSGGMSSGGNGQ